MEYVFADMRCTASESALIADLDAVTQTVDREPSTWDQVTSRPLLAVQRLRGDASRRDRAEPRDLGLRPHNYVSDRRSRGLLVFTTAARAGC
jgi:hypothetical protein